MSRKSQRNRPTPTESPAAAAAGRSNRRGFLVGVVVAVVVIVLAAVMLYRYAGLEEGDAGLDPAALASEHAPTLGDPGARVHIVEFLDPACETCALFYPVVKQLIAQNPGRIKLSVRHVPFHTGADYVVRVLEASRTQDRYWETLEALFATQEQWVPHHTVQPDRVAPAIASVGLDMDRLAQDMQSPEVEERMRRDRQDAMTLKVTATPEYFVNGRPMPSFGYEQLLRLVREELERAY
jgi:protein-disulfide isomerase